ncbi:MAG TPA: DUF4430 domain-containing protein [Patescibacteria group bacterium]|nr:DUF4430 domain-containing protein [Patescibacteria group bacterium]
MNQKSPFSFFQQIVTRYFLFVLVFLFAGVFLLSSQQQVRQTVENFLGKTPIEEESVAGTATQKEDVAKEIHVTLKLEKGEGQARSYDMSVPQKTTVYDLLKKASERHGFSLQATDYGAEMGMFVEEIDGVQNSKEQNSYWLYFVNEVSAEVGPSQREVQEGETVSWRYKVL